MGCDGDCWRNWRTSRRTPANDRSRASHYGDRNGHYGLGGMAGGCKVWFGGLAIGLMLPASCRSDRCCSSDASPASNRSATARPRHVDFDEPESGRFPSRFRLGRHGNYVVLVRNFRSGRHRLYRCGYRNDIDPVRYKIRCLTMHLVSERRRWLSVAAPVISPGDARDRHT